MKLGCGRADARGRFILRARRLIPLYCWRLAAIRMRYLCLDLGDKRTGVAAGDDETGVAAPVGVLQVPLGDRLLTAVLDAVEAHGPDAIVLGLPLNMDDTEGPRARLVREFGRQLAAHTDRPVHYQDERLTSHAAEGQLAGSGRTHKEKKELRDALAAAEILRDFLRGRAAEATPGAGS
jgi:putative Holliday junction resolvase